MQDLRDPTDDDLVLFLDEESSRAFIGRVRSIHPLENPVTLINVVDKSCTDKDSEEAKATRFKYCVEWTSLTTGDDYVPEDSPLPSIVNSDRLFLLDRNFPLASAVSRSDRKDVLGSVCNVHNKAHVEILGHDCALFNIDCSRLRSVYPWTVHTNEHYVIWKGWFGHIVGVRMAVIIRFMDGARLLMLEDGLERFEPVSPSSDVWPETCYEGAWLQGDMLGLKTYSGTSQVFSWFSNLASRMNRCNKPSITFGSLNTETSSSNIDKQNENPTYSNTKPNKQFYPGHVDSLLRDIMQSPLMKNSSKSPDYILSMLHNFPVFLTETRAHNALWLSKLQDSVEVPVYVERYAPIEATIRWLANYNPNIPRPCSVVQGSDLVDVKSVAQNASIYCNYRDVWYYQIDESDVFYDIGAAGGPETIFYNFYTGNQEALDAVKVELHENEVTNQSFTEKSPAVSPDTSVRQSSDPEVTVLPRTTPFWAQKTLKSWARPKTRVIMNPKHRLNYSDLMQWFRSEQAMHNILLEEYSDSDDDEHCFHNYDDPIKPSKIRAISKTDLKRKSSSNQPNKVGTSAQPIQSNAKTSIDTDSGMVNQSKLEDSCLETSKPPDAGVGENTETKPNKSWDLLNFFSLMNGMPSGRSSGAPSEIPPEDIKKRRSLMPNLKPGQWVPVGLYASFSELDVQWNDGVLESRVPAYRLVNSYDLTANDFLVGDLVNLKSGARHEPETNGSDTVPNVENPDKSTVTESTQDKPSSQTVLANYLQSNDAQMLGFILSANSKDRICRVQWFQLSSDKKTLDPVGTPEEVGVYDLIPFVGPRYTHGDIVLIDEGPYSKHATMPAGFVENVKPESGELVIRWVDGTLSDVSLAHCICTIGEFNMSLPDENDSSSDTDISDFLETSSDSEWETDSTLLDLESDQNQAETNESLDSITGCVPRSAAIRIACAYRWALLTRSMISHVRNFVYSLLRHYVIHPQPDHVVKDTLGLFLFAIMTSKNLSSDLTISSNPSPNHLDNYPTVAHGSTAVDEMTSDKSDSSWDHSMVGEAVAVLKMISQNRRHIGEAFKLTRDCRIKKMWYLWDSDELLPEKHIEGFVKICEMHENSPSTSFSSTENIRIPISSTLASKMESEHVQKSDSNHLLGTTNLNISQFVREDCTLRDWDSIAPCINKLDVTMTLTDGPQINESGESSIASPIRFVLPDSSNTLPNDGITTVQVMMDRKLFTQAIKYIKTIHRDSVERIDHFCNLARTWLHECNPDLIDIAEKWSCDDRYKFDDLAAIIMKEWTGKEIADDLLKIDVNAEYLSELNDEIQNMNSKSDHSDLPNHSVANACNADSVCPNEVLANHHPSNSVPSENHFIESMADQKSKPVPLNCEFDMVPDEQRGQFTTEEHVPPVHRFFDSVDRLASKDFYKASRRDRMLLCSSLPKGIFVKGFEDRMDLFSVMIVGPSGTPYEHGLFFFDVQLPSNYPHKPPNVYYYCIGGMTINPNLYEDGKICLSLLGTWHGEGSETWDSERSSLLQLVVSLQGLILNPEPFFNEHDRDSERRNPKFREPSRAYNEYVIISVLQCMTILLQNPITIFKEEIIQHCISNMDPYLSLLDFWTTLEESEFQKFSSMDPTSRSQPCLPEFPLAPISKGFQISIRRYCDIFQKLVQALKG